MFFLDQFGYSSFDMGMISQILKNEVCEIFSYLNWNMLHPFMTDDTKSATISAAFGGDEWRQVSLLSGHEKEERFREIYLDALRNRGGASYAYPFAMRDNNDRVIYWLFFSTNSLRGLEEMKLAMWEVDRSGGFEFSDRHAHEVGKLFSYDDQRLANDLVKEFDGKPADIATIREFVLVNTPATKIKALGLLEKTAV